MRKGSLSALPLRAFLNRKVTEIGVSGVASATGLDARRVRTLCDGYYYAGGRRYEIKGSTRYLIDRCVTPFGEVPSELYGPEWYAGVDHVLQDAKPKAAATTGQIGRA